MMVRMGERMVRMVVVVRMVRQVHTRQMGGKMVVMGRGGRTARGTGGRR